MYIKFINFIIIYHYGDGVSIKYVAEKLLKVDAAIGNDREVIKDIYGQNKFLDISNINELTNRISMILKNLL